MTHLEALANLRAQFGNNKKIAERAEIQEPAVDGWFQHKRLPGAYWPLVDYVHSSKVDVSMLKVADAKALYEELKGIFG
jgi:hypothetical protein